MMILFYRIALILFFGVALFSSWAIGPTRYQIESVSIGQTIQIEMSSKVISSGIDALFGGFAQGILLGASLLFLVLVFTDPLWSPGLLNAALRFLAIGLMAIGIVSIAAVWAWLSLPPQESVVVSRLSDIPKFLSYAANHRSLMLLNGLPFFFGGAFLFFKLERKRIGVPDSGRVEAIMDGDTFKLDNGEAVRLRWVDAPEKGQGDLAMRARDRLHALVVNRSVKLHYPEGKQRDKYGRLLAEVYVRRWFLRKIYVQKDLAGRGLVFYNQESKSKRDFRLEQAQAWAKTLRRGIYGQKIERPDAYRKKKNQQL